MTEVKKERRPSPEDLLGSGDLAAMWSVSVETARRILRRDPPEIPIVKLTPGIRRVRRRDAEAFVDARTVKP
jgi:hypothetical protein